MRTIRLSLAVALMASLGCGHRDAFTSRVVIDTAMPYHRRVEVPHLAPSASAGAAKINDYFEQRIATEYACSVDAADVKSLTFDFRARVTVTRGALLGVTVEYDSYCGGAHPNSGTSSLFFDLRTGAAVDLDRLVKQGRKPTLVDRYIARVGAVDGECAELLAPASLQDTTFDFLPNEVGARVIPVLPYAMRACAGLASLSWAELGEVLDLAQFE